MENKNTHSGLESEIKSWLKFALKEEKLKDLSVNISGNSEKGDGYMGDIVFVTVNGTNEDDIQKEYDLVLKCSKRSQVLRASSPVKEAFFNEIFMYEKVLPIFAQLQNEKRVKDCFDSVPKCYGTFTGENMEVIILENLKKKGFVLWPKKQPLTRKHVDLVVKEYGKLHATSVALEKENLLKFNDLIGFFSDMSKNFIESGNMKTLFEKALEESYDILKNDLEEVTLAKWKKFKDDIDSVIKEMNNITTGLKVILHGDCWNNNFMYLHKDDSEKIPLQVAFLDWQVSRYSTPIQDLSYFIFTCTSKDDLERLDEILTLYHKTFITHLAMLGVNNSEEIYPLTQFLNEWKTYSKYGIMMASLLMKICSTDADEVLDIAQVVESGKSFTDSFANTIKDKNNFKIRIRPIVEYAAKHNII